MRAYKFGGPALVLIWTTYYYAKRYAGGVVNTLDTVVCGTVATISIIFIAKRIINIWQEKKHRKEK